jgi:hypothetical protein
VQEELKQNDPNGAPVPGGKPATPIAVTSSFSAVAEEKIDLALDDKGEKKKRSHMNASPKRLVDTSVIFHSQR